MAAFEVIALDTATPQLRAPGASDTYTFPRAVELPLGTANGVLYLNGSKVVTSGSALVFDASGNLGLGVTPSAWVGNRKVLAIGGLAVANVNYAATIGENAYNFYYTSGGTPTYQTTAPAAIYDFNNSASGGFAWKIAPSGTAGNPISFTQAMTLDASGNLGVGTTSPAYRLDVAKSGDAAWIRVGDSSANGGAGVIFKGASTSVKNWVIANQYNVNGGLEFTQTTANGGSTIGSTPAMTLDASGNLQIGNTSYAYRVAASRASDGIVGYFRRDGSTVNPALTISCNETGNTVGFGTDYAGATSPAMTFSTQGTERARITSGGDLLVGKTATDGSVVGVQLLPSGASAFTRSGSTNATSTLDVYSTGAGAYRFYVGMDGTVNATNTTISAISDQRLKENIRDLDVGLNAIMTLKPRKFDWKEGKGKNIKGDRGWIAQEFEQVFPDMIDTWKDEAPEGEEPYKSVRADLIPVLVKAIQELKAEFDAYKATHP